MTEDELKAFLRKGTDTHTKLLDYLTQRIRMSEDKMKSFYARWNSQELKMQAYLTLPKYDKLLEDMNKTGLAPQAATLTIPYNYATVATIVTYMVPTFTGRRPIFQVGAYGSEGLKNSTAMETLLQHNADTGKVVLRFIQLFKDTETYGVGALRCLWGERYRYQTRTETTVAGDAPVKRLVKYWQGNEIDNIDPFLFFPDPRVPMAEVADKGEFVFWREFTSKLKLKKAESQGELVNVDGAGELPAARTASVGESFRGIRAGGTGTPGADRPGTRTVNSYVQVDQGTVEIIPSELGLGDSDYPEKWLFTILNEQQVVQAEPLDYDHGSHPVSVCESQSMGHGFGNLSTADYLSPLQDAMSWFLNSHMHNVRAALNNMLVVNPAMVHMKDLEDPEPGKLIRMRRSALSQDPRMAVMQLKFNDVTQSHVGDLVQLMRLGDMMSAVSDNVRGIQAATGRKTATEVRTSGEAAASRLAAQARFYSAQGISPLGDQMACNYQQFMDMELALKNIRNDDVLQLKRDAISGTFFFPVHDGTLPIDKVAMLDIWKEIMFGVAKDQELRGMYSLPKIFEHVAELGGAQNIESFRVNVASPEGLQAAAQAGDAVPVDMNNGGMNGP